MSEELKPCPFCASDAVFLSFDEMVSCSNCGATANNKIDWNLRATPDQEPVSEPKPKQAWRASSFRGLPPALKEAQDITMQRVANAVQKIYDNREKLLEAWIAETGLGPSESMLVEQHMGDGTVRVYVKRKEEPKPMPSPEQSDRERAERAWNDWSLHGKLDGQNVYEMLASLLAEVRAEERERCAQVCKTMFNPPSRDRYCNAENDGIARCADAIRRMK